MIVPGCRSPNVSRFQSSASHQRLGSSEVDCFSAEGNHICLYGTICMPCLAGQMFDKFFGQLECPCCCMKLFLLNIVGIFLLTLPIWLMLIKDADSKTDDNSVTADGECDDECAANAWIHLRRGVQAVVSISCARRCSR